MSEAWHWSEPQLELIRFAFDSRPVIHAEGPTQSGKSAGVAYSFVAYVKQHDFPEMDGFLVACPTLEQVNSVLSNIELAAEMQGVHCTVQTGGTAVLDGHRILGKPLKDAGAWRAFHGKRFGGVIIDEANKCDPEGYNYTYMRANRVPVGKQHAKRWTTCNPDAPNHWFHVLTDRLQQPIVHSNIDDNPSLTEEWKADLRDTLSGAILQRMYYGKRAAHSGLVWPQFAKTLRRLRAADGVPVGQPLYYELSADAAISTVTHVIKWAVYADGHRRAVAEWRWDGRERGHLASGEQARQIAAWAGHPRAVYCDPAAAHLKVDLQLALPGVPIIDAVNDVAAGIQSVHTLLEHGRFTVDMACRETIRECSAYQWDEQALKRGVPDVPLKRDDHAPDALRYYLHTLSVTTPVQVRSW